MRVLFFSAKPYDIRFFNEQAKNSRHTLEFMDVALSMHTASLASGYDAICIFVNDRVDAEVVTALSRLGIKLIALRCAGFNNVDLNAAAKAGIKVVRVPAYSPHAVAEHTLALVLTLNRKTHRAYNRIRESNFSLNGLIGFDLYGKTVGIIGLGKIGRVTAGIFHGFGCRVLGFDVVEPEGLSDAGIEFSSLSTIFAQSDIISLHCPLNPDTFHLINPVTIAAMKPGVMLINTSRGALIDTKAVIGGLKLGTIGALGLDVYEEEEHLFFKDLSDELMLDDVFSRLQSFNNVLITGHQAFLTSNALTNIADITLENLSAFEEGVLRNEVVAG